MSTMVIKGKEMIRISPKDPRKLEYSNNNGANWLTRWPAQSRTGSFIDLMDNGRELFATTSEGLFCSTNNGLSWTRRSC